MISRYSVREWAELKSNAGTRGYRWAAIQKLAESCGGGTVGLGKYSPEGYVQLDKWGTQFIEDCLSGKTDPYRVANSMVQWLTERKYSRYYVAGLLNPVKLFLKINRVDIVDEEWSAKVQVPQATREKDKGTLSTEGVRLLIADSDPEYQVLYEIMGIGGSRILETVSLRMKDVFFKPEIPDIPLVRLRNTKIGVSRDFPISRECYGLIRRFNKHTGEYPLFPHLATCTFPKNAAQQHCHKQMIRLGLSRRAEWLNGNGKEAWTLSIHNFRQFAENNIVKHWGDHEAPDVAKWLVGRKASLGSRGAYQTLEDIAPRWKQWVEPYCNWLSVEQKEQAIPETSFRQVFSIA